MTVTNNMYRPRDFYNEKDQEVYDIAYAAALKAVVEIVQSANFLGPVESNNGFTQNGVPIAGGSAHTIENEGVDLTQRDTLNFTGAGVNAADAGGKTVVTIPGGGAVDSVNGETGDVVLDTDDIDEGDTNKYNVTHTGEVTGATELTIAADVVDNTNLANMVQSTIKGRAAAAGTGDPADLSAAQVRTILNVADGANAYTHPNHTGDVTSVADGATTIADEAVTNAKMADMAESTFKARGKGAGTGAPQNLSAVAAREVLRGSVTDTSDATPEINVDAVAYYELTAQAANITAITYTGTPTVGQTLWISITTTGSYTVAFDATDFESSDTFTCPATGTEDTIDTTSKDYGFKYHGPSSKFRLVAVA